MASDPADHLHACLRDAQLAGDREVAAAGRPPFFASSDALAVAINAGPLPTRWGSGRVQAPLDAQSSPIMGFPGTLSGVVAAIRQAPNLESLRHVCALMQRLPKVVIEAPRRRVLHAALHASASRLVGREIETTNARTPCYGLQGFYDLLDAAGQINTVIEVDAWLSALARHRLPYPEQTRALRERLGDRRYDLLGAPRAGRRQIMALGPGSYRPLIEELSRQIHGLPTDAASPTARRVADLPEPLPHLIDYWARRNPLPRPQLPTAGMGDDGDSWIHAALGPASWRHRVAPAFQRAGVPVFDTVPTFAEDRLVERPPASPLITSPQRDVPQRDAPQRDAWESEEWRRVEAEAWGMGKLLAGQLRFSHGEALSSRERPDFLPMPVPACSVLDMAQALLMRDVASLAFFRGALAVATVTPGGFDSPLCPPSLRAIAPALLRFSTHEERLEALPWLLVHYLATQSAQAGWPPGQVSLQIATQVGGRREPFEGLYVELAPDLDESRHQARLLYGGQLENRVIRKLRRYAPDLLHLIEPRRRIALPAVEALIAANRDRAPLAGVNIVCIQHVLDDNAATLSRLAELGAHPATVHILGVPYSTNERAAQHLRAAGLDVDTSGRKDLRFHTLREVQVCNLIRKALEDHEVNGRPIVALDDGGHIAAMLHKHFLADAHKFTIVEQTTRGITVAEKFALRCAVINVARSESKKLELPGVKEAIQREIRSRLAPFFDEGFRPGQPAIVLGFGWIGEIVTEALQEMGRQVIVVDPSAEARMRAERVAGVETQARITGRLLRTSAIVAGCSGFQSLTRRHLEQLNGQVLFSTSSARIEFDLPGESHFHDDVLVTGEGNYLVLAAGFPINFSGKGEVGNPRFLQYTCASMLAGLLQAVRIAGSGISGVIPLDPARVREIRLLAARAGDIQPSLRGC